MKSVDIVIVGQGLAGTTLAWQLRALGKQVLVIDGDLPGKASAIAAGLMTPITGQRLVMSWRFPELWAAAVPFYRQIETQTGCPLLTIRPMVRLFRDFAERDLFNRRTESDFLSLVEGPLNETEITQASLQENGQPAISAPWGGFRMPHAGHLHVSTFLAESRKIFQKEDSFQLETISPETDIDLRSDGVYLEKMGVRCQQIIFCQGYLGIPNPWFSHIPFNPAKGELLTLHIPGLEQTEILHRKIWLLPNGNHIFQIGATYEWKQLDTLPTQTRADELTEKLREFLQIPFTMVAHQAAVRPVIEVQRPLLGFLPNQPRIGFFNGLGSKGSLMAPFFAGQLARFITEGKRLDREVDLAFARTSR